MEKIERITTGVKGLDEKMQGGFYRGSVNLITGKTGTGKTAFSSTFLFQGALKGEPGFYMSTEERVEDIRGDIAAMFGWDLSQIEKKKLLNFIYVKPTFPLKSINTEEMNKFVKLYLFDITDQVVKGIKANDAKRVVIDSVSIIEMFVKDEYLSRTVLIQLVEKLKSLGVTVLLTGTIPETSEALSGGGIIEYIVDSVIKLDFLPVAEDFKRTLTIRKMRRTDHSVHIHPFEIGKSGIEIIEIPQYKTR
ncbi:MAG: ATPase [Candidatus Aenigmarchaeota archaeon]|nr:ATPase [Candidatus Aenigmarchaeota archaeon]